MPQERFLKRVFRIAAVYNIAWGATVALFPNLFFDLFQIERINYPFVMSGLGMCIGLYGYGYWIVARDLRKYPQLVIIGFLGKTNRSYRMALDRPHHAASAAHHVDQRLQRPDLDPLFLCLLCLVQAARK